MTTLFGRGRVATLALAGAVLIAVAGCQGLPRSAGTASRGAAPAAPAGGSSAGTSAGGASAGAGSAGALTRAPIDAATAGLAVGGRVPRGFVAWSVTFASSLTAYVLGDAPCHRAPCTSVVRTLDGGRTWRGLPAPVASLPANRDFGSTPSTVRDIRFGTARDGYAFGGGLWSTHDGARSWHRLNVGRVLDLAIGGGTTYAVVGTCDADGAGCRDIRLVTSPVGRDAFSRVGLAPGASGGGGVSTGAGIAVVTLNQVVYVRHAGAWSRAAAACTAEIGVPPGPGRVIPPAAGSTLTAFCPEGAAGSAYFTIRQSADFGRHWGAVPGPALRLPNGLISLTAGSASVLAGASATPDLRGGLFVSQNGGRTWAAAALPRTVAGWRYVGARSATALVALADPPAPTLWTSADGGRSWPAHPIR
jgi:hypothetical protein